MCVQNRLGIFKGVWERSYKNKKNDRVNVNKNLNLDVVQQLSLNGSEEKQWQIFKVKFAVIFPRNIIGYDIGGTKQHLRN